MKISIEGVNITIIVIIAIITKLPLASNLLVNVSSGCVAQLEDS